MKTILCLLFEIFSWGISLLLRTFKFKYRKRRRSTYIYDGTENKYISALTLDSRLSYSNWDNTRICKYNHYIHGVEFTMLGLDTHADISCAGRDAVITAKLEGRTCAVHPFNDTYKAMTGIEIVNVLLKYMDKDGEEYILEINQCLNFTDTMKHSILCTNQARHGGLIINDVPRILDRSSPQDIRIKDGETIINLEMNGPIPYVPVSRPSQHDIEYLPRLTLTRDDVEWDPQYIFNEGQQTIHPYLENDYILSYDIQGLRALSEMVTQHESRISALAHMNSGKLTANEIATLWGIGIKAAERTLRSTTQLSTRHLNG